MKNEILAMLYASSEYISGETICKKLNVSRTSVWKHINTLKKEGYQISSVNNKGYKLIKEDLPVNKYEIDRHYKGEMEIVYIDKTPSTNTYAKEIFAQISKEVSLVFTGVQTEGRGRLGREFMSDNDKGTWTSFVFKPNMDPSKATIFTLAASVAVCKLLKEQCDVDAKIKWPNDIIVNHKKICGILTEMSCEMDSINYIIVGIGINLLQEEFDKSLSEIATSVYQIKKQKYDRGLLISHLCYNIDDIYADIKNSNVNKILSEWNRFSLTNGKEIKIIKDKQLIYGVAKGIDEDGRLIVKINTGEEQIFNSGEISIRGIMGYA